MPEIGGNAETEKTMGKFCKKCGNPINENSKFCPKCGNHLMAGATPPANETPKSTPMDVPLPLPEIKDAPKAFAHDLDPAESYEGSKLKVKKKKKKSKAILAFVIILLSAALIADGIFLALGKSSSKGDNNGKAESVTTTGTEAPPEPEIDPEDIERTIMIYIVGSDLESGSSNPLGGGGAATADIEEMLDAKFDTEKNHVLVYTGGAKKWKLDEVDADENSILLIEEDEISVVKTYDSKNMGKSKTLTEFLNFAEENYPADQYSLILWDHGGGPLIGYGYDEVHMDILSLKELEDALEDSPFGKDNKLEMVGFDACLMGSLESAWIFRDYAEYFVASQEVEPGWGWNYTFLDDIDKCTNGADMGKVIIDSYFDYCEEIFDLYPRYESEVTLSCTKLSKIDTVEEKLTSLFEVVNEKVEEGKIQTASRCRRNSKVFGKIGSSSDYDLVDLVHLTDLLSDTYSSEAKALDKTLKDYVVYSRSNVDNANGVSVYHPYDNLGMVSDAVSVFEKIKFSDGYTEYIESFTDAMQNGSSSSYRDFSKVMGSVEQDDSDLGISISLTEEQMETYSSSRIVVIKEIPASETPSGKTECLPVFIGYDTTLAEDGTLTANYDCMAVYGKNSTTNEYSELPLLMWHVYDDIESYKYYFNCIFKNYHVMADIIASGGEVTESMDDIILSVEWLAKLTDGEIQLLGAYPSANGLSNLPQKQLIDSEDYEFFEFGCGLFFLEENEDGEMSVGTLSGSSYYKTYSQEEGFSLELLPIDLEDGFYAYFIIEDIYGDSYESSLMPLCE